MEKKEEDVQNSYIMREYFKSFKQDTQEINKIRDKFNTTNPSLILDNIAKQNVDIFYVIKDHYSKSIDMFQKVGDHIHHIGEMLKDKNSFQEKEIEFIFLNKDQETNMEELKCPISIKRINLNISHNANTIQECLNEIKEKSNYIENSAQQIKDEETFMAEVFQELSLFVESIRKDSLKEVRN